MQESPTATTNRYPESASAESLREIQERYARRIKARLAQPAIDVTAARDGMLDCFVSTYHAGLAAGVKGILDIDAGEAQVARLARSLFRKKLEAQGVSFDAPTVAALDAVKTDVDEELHFEALPAEMRGVHDQVCSLLLAKAEGSLAHAGDAAVVRRHESSPPAAGPVGAPPVAAPSAPRPSPAARTVEAPQAVSAAPLGPVRASCGTVEAGLRAALAGHLDGLRDAAVAGASTAELRVQVEQLDLLLGTLERFADAR